MPARSAECVAPASPTTISRNRSAWTGRSAVVNRLVAKRNAAANTSGLLLLRLFLRGLLRRRLVLHGDDLAVHRVDVHFGDAGAGFDIERVDELAAFIFELRAFDFSARNLLQDRKSVV